MGIPAAGSFPVGDPTSTSVEPWPELVAIQADAVDVESRDLRSLDRGVEAVEAQALEALLVRRGSGSAVLEDGQKFHALDRITGDLPRLLRSEVEYAWRRLVRDGLIQLLSVDVDSEDVAVGVTIRFRNLVSGANGTLALPIGTLLGRAPS